MKVTIIIPAYNAEGTIERCVRSALEQTWQELEILAVNDGSTDGTGAVLQRIAAEPEQGQQETGQAVGSGRQQGANPSGRRCSARLRILEQDNHGASYSRARGTALAEGEYLTFLDADDYLAPDYIENFALAAERTQADLYLCGYTEVFADGRKREHPAGAVYERGTAEEYAYRMLAACARFYRTDFCRECDFPVVSGAVRGEDIPVGLKTNYMAEEICLVNQCGYYYVQHGGSARHQLRGLKRYELPLGEIRRTVRECAMAEKCSHAQGHWHFLEFGVLRVFVTFLWDLGQGAGRERQRAIYAWERELLENELQDWADNPYLRLFTGLQVPFYQKAAVWLFLQLYRTGWLDLVYLDQ